MTSSTEEAPAGHVTGGDALNDEAQSLLIGCVDDLTSVRAPASKSVKVFVCSTGTGDRFAFRACLLR